MNIEILLSEIQRDGYNNHIFDIEKVQKYGNNTERAELARLLCQYNNKHAQKILLSLVCDIDSYVRVEAADSLSSFSSSEIYFFLKKQGYETNTLVRGYKQFALASNVPMESESECVELLEKTLQNEKKTFVKIMALQGLCLLGKQPAAIRLLKMYPHCNYQNRCAILNGIADLIGLGVNFNKTIIYDLYDQAKNETLPAVMSAFNHFCEKSKTFLH